LTRRPTVIDFSPRRLPQKSSNKIEEIEESSEFQEKSDLSRHTHKLTMAQVEGKVNEIVTSTKEEIMTDVKTKNREIVTQFESKYTMVDNTIKSVKNSVSSDIGGKLKILEKHFEDLKMEVGDNKIKISGFFEMLNEEAKRRKRDKTDLTLL
jgi:hypothetical protein